jgi:hypothetical protein
MNLDDKIWSTAKGGYKIPYDASRLLRRLRDASQRDESDSIFSELWDNLHHQGDVGLASYLAVPQLVAICMEKRYLDWNFIGLCVTIEQARLEDHNPEIPPEFQDIYFDSLGQFEKYLLSNFKNISDRTALRLTLSLLATVNGQPSLGKAIGMMEEDLLAEFLEQY